MKRILYSLFAAFTLLLVGCTTIMNSDKMVIVKTRGLGIIVETSSTSANSTPSVKMGFFSEIVQIIPTGTNVVYAPPYMDTFNIGQSANPFDTTIQEDTGIGNVTLGGTNAPSARFSTLGPIRKSIVATPTNAPATK